jgi:hypothetical protein
MFRHIFMTTLEHILSTFILIILYRYSVTLYNNTHRFWLHNQFTATPFLTFFCYQHFGSNLLINIKRTGFSISLHLNMKRYAAVTYKNNITVARIFILLINKVTKMLLRITLTGNLFVLHYHSYKINTFNPQSLLLDNNIFLYYSLKLIGPGFNIFSLFFFTFLPKPLNIKTRYKATRNSRFKFSKGVA